MNGCHEFFNYVTNDGYTPQIHAHDFNFNYFFIVRRLRMIKISNLSLQELKNKFILKDFCRNFSPLNF